MGKLTRLIISLIIIDLLFIITGQIEAGGNLSIIGSLIANPASKTSLFFLLFLGITGIASLVASSSVSSGIITRGADILVFTSMALAMASMLGDFATIYMVLRGQNEILATLIMVPIMGLFVMTIAEWLRGKD